jgi:hypothetical protein
MNTKNHISMSLYSPYKLNLDLCTDLV